MSNHHHHHCHKKRRGSRFSLRLVVFLAITTVVVLTALRLAFPDMGPRAAADEVVTITMAGFNPSPVVIEADREITLRLDNPDSPHHTDGGGVHQFAVPELGIDVLVQPRSSEVITIPATAASEYAFYCDTCCGGKENPSMQGTLIVS